MTKRKSAPAPLDIPATLTDAQRAMIENATSDAARAILRSLFERAKA